MNKEIQQKIASCKALQNMTVADVINTQRFADNLAKYLNAQREDRKAIRASYAAMIKAGGSKRYKLPAHVIDHFETWTVGEFTAAYLECINKKYNGPFAERQYITQLGQQAYNVTVCQYVVEEFPELEPVLFPKNKQS